MVSPKRYGVLVCIRSNFWSRKVRQRMVMLIFETSTRKKRGFNSQETTFKLQRRHTCVVQRKDLITRYSMLNLSCQVAHKTHLKYLVIVMLNFSFESFSICQTPILRCTSSSLLPPSYVLDATWSTNVFELLYWVTVATCCCRWRYEANASVRERSVGTA